MSTITPILDTLLHQVLGRRADLARFTATRPNAPLLAIARLPAARDAATQTGLQAERLLTTKAGGSEGVRDGARAPARTPHTPGGAGNANPGGMRADASAGSAQLHFSREGQAISSLLSRFATAPMATSYTQAPLFSGSQAPAASMLASMLGRQVANSGVFYESHLLKWLDGKRSLKQLSQEPQARLNKSNGGTPKALTVTAASTPGRAPAPQAPGAAAGASANSAGLPPIALGAARGLAAAEPIHEAMLPVVRQQLDVLSSSVFRWQGLAWPDVPMQWEVHEHEQAPHEQGEADDQTDNDSGATRYSTRLKLELPVLGALEVRIMLSANTLQMYAWAATDTGAAALQPQTTALQRRLERAGFDAASVQLLTDTPA